MVTALDTFKLFDSIYFREELEGLDPYDVFIGGLGPITVIENNLAQSDEELIMFKDSYSHSLAPFLAQHFKSVTLFDLRYVRKEYIYNTYNLTGKTILFIYSTTILNTDPQILN
ncbi:DHHW family protein [Chloroflexota bacterium]